MASTSSAVGRWPPPSGISSSSPGFMRRSRSWAAAWIAAVVACRASLTRPSAKRLCAAVFAAWIASMVPGTSGAPPRSSIQARARASDSTSTTAGCSVSAPSGTSPGLKRPSAVSTTRSPPVRLISLRPTAAGRRAASPSLAPASFLTMSNFEWSSMNCVGLAAGRTGAAPEPTAASSGASSAKSSDSTSSSSDTSRSVGADGLPNHSCQPSRGQPRASSTLMFGRYRCRYKVLPIL
mmetsp:Transcript_110383/g.317468  ORF Transcript_110383/g.317468 Transcript_110383/m.317468 type:complete len:237 (+) Transcript_110383:540-1250(+)